MTTSEFSTNFDTLLNSYTYAAEMGNDASPKQIILDEYEKSVFLTNAQERLVLSYYNGNNSNLKSFEETEEMRRYLSSLIQTSYINPTSGYAANKKIKDDSQVFQLPADLWFITYESVKLPYSSNKCVNGIEIPVIPVTQDDFHRTMDNPFKGPSRRRVLRLDLDGNCVELISKYTIQNYIVRYVKRLTPIVLENLEDLSIDGVSIETQCQLHPCLHKAILDLAVLEALQSKGIKVQQ